MVFYPVIMWIYFIESTNLHRSRINVYLIHFTCNSIHVQVGSWFKDLGQSKLANWNELIWISDKCLRNLKSFQTFCSFCWLPFAFCTNYGWPYWACIFFISLNTTDYDGMCVFIAVKASQIHSFALFWICKVCVFKYREMTAFDIYDVSGALCVYCRQPFLPILAFALSCDYTNYYSITVKYEFVSKVDSHVC